MVIAVSAYVGSPRKAGVLVRVRTGCMAIAVIGVHGDQSRP